MNDRTPILVFAYNRPHHLRRALGALAACRRLDECAVFLYSDGAKTPEQATHVEAVRQVMRDWAEQHGAHIPVERIERDHNFGLARSIVQGVSEQCARFGRVIVLEDDLIVSPDCLEYLLDGLAAYADAPNVYQISAHTYPLRPPADQPFFLMPLTTTWGWATWARAWQAFAGAPLDAQAFLADPVERARFDLNGAYPFSEMLERRLAGQIDSWGILWWYAVFQAGGLVLYPQGTLVRNEGFDGSGTHYTSTVAPIHPESAAWWPLPVERDFPPPQQVDWEMFVRTRNWLRESQRPAPALAPPRWIDRARGRVGQVLKRLSRWLRLSSRTKRGSGSTSSC